MNFNKDMLLLYAVTDRTWANKKSLMEQIELALEGGVTMLQLREKNLDEDSFIQEAIEVKRLCEKYNVPLIINDNVYVALKSGADGVHVGIEDDIVSNIRRCVPNDFIIGATCKTIEQAGNAAESGADYMGVGAVFASQTKNNAIRLSIEQLNEICDAVNIPAVAIGGIDFNNVDELKGCKASGIAVVKAIFGMDDIKNSTIELRKKAVKYFKKGELK